MRVGQGGAPHNDINYGTLIPKLRREWPADDPIRDTYVEMKVAPDTLNRLFAHLAESRTGNNINLLLSFAAWAFYRHHIIPLAEHRCASGRILARTANGTTARWPIVVMLAAKYAPRATGGRVLRL